MIARASFISDIKNQILSTSIRIFCLSSITFCSQSVWRSVGIFYFLSSYAGLELHHLLVGPSVSLIYNTIIDCITKPLSIKTIWIGNYLTLNLSVDWREYGPNLSLTSKNLAHRLIHFKVIHRAYITPYKDLKLNYSQI